MAGTGRSVQAPGSARSVLLPLVLLFLLATACRGTDRRQAETLPGDDHAALDVMDSVHVDLTGAGASLPYPLYARWFNEYAQVANLRINYLSVGSGEGMARVSRGAVDFGATDVPMTDTELASTGRRLRHIPTVIGAVAVTYRLPGVSRPLRLTGPLIADIFLGRVRRWRDPRLLAINPDLTLPDTTITVVHRTDASGTSFIFSDYLSAVSPDWQRGPGRGRQVAWPVGVGAEGTESAAARIRQTVGAIGYVEVGTARLLRLPTAHLQNRAGRFISPMPYEMASAATAVLEKRTAAVAGGSADFRVSLVDAPGAASYPLTSLTWLLVDPDALGPVRTRQLADFLRWAFFEAGEIASSLGYVPLPMALSQQVLEQLDARATGTR